MKALKVFIFIVACRKQIVASVAYIIIRNRVFFSKYTKYFDNEVQLLLLLGRWQLWNMWSVMW